MKCMYHADFDGKLAAFWVHQLAPKLDDYDEEYIMINYGMEFPFEKIKKDEQVFIVDYSIMPEEMEELLKITNNVTWIDHHISAIKRYDGFPHQIPGLRYDGIAGCMLTYCYFKHMLVHITAVVDAKSNLNGGLNRTVTVYTADGDVIATYQGKIDIDTNDGGYVKFDYDGKRYIYYNCFVESVADIN